MFLSSSTPYGQDSFHLKQHLQDFLGIEQTALEELLQTGQEKLANLGNNDFCWETVEDFYRNKVKNLYLFELAAWHLDGNDYIHDTVRLVADHAQGKVLDFGGGIGTHSLAAAYCSQVQQVIYYDINPTNLEFVKYRVHQLKLQHKFIFCQEICEAKLFDTILCFDVIEHLSNPCHQLLQFHRLLTPQGKLIINWYFFKGFDQEYPFHLDDLDLVNDFFIALQNNFLEVFHPYLITSRCYRKLTH